MAMPQCLCSGCKSIFECSLSQFGELYRCPDCGFEFKPDTQNLAHYNLPDAIKIQLVSKEGAPFIDFSVPVMVDYGYYVPPILSDKTGRVVITGEVLFEAKREYISTGIMDYKYDDYSLNRFVIIRINDKKEASQISKKRLGSGWPISNLEKKLYHNMDKLAAAFIPLEDIVPVEKFIDLSQEKHPAELEITIITK
jgi:hypothetical protein